MGSTAFEIQEVKQGVEGSEDIFGGSKTEKVLVQAVLKMLPGMEEREAKELLDKEISEEELAYLLPLVRDCLGIEGDLGNEGGWRDFDVSRFGKEQRKLAQRNGDEMRAFGIRQRTTSPKKEGTAKLQTKDGEKQERSVSKASQRKSKRALQSLRIAAAYKSKAKKVRPVDANDGTGDNPGGLADWYARAKLREHKQEHIGKYKDHLLPRITAIPRGSRLTPERLKALDVGTWLWDDEKAMFDELMINREGALAFDWKEVGKIHEDVSPPIVIKTIEHKAWQEPNFPCPRALIPIVVKMLQERLERGVLEKCDGPYRNPWFLVAKKLAGTYRLINAAMKMNSVTLRDANLPPSVDEFSEEFAGCVIASLIDFFSGYDQLTLDKRSRDMTAFHTPLGLLRMTTPPQGATNSVAQFVRVIMTILEELFPKVAMPFIDDVGVKGPYTDYNNELKLPGIRRYVYEHLQNLDRTLERIERAGACIGPKSQFCYNGMVIVGFVCGAEGRGPEEAKVRKINNWTRCDNPTEAKAFMGICTYYRIWIQNYSQIAEPIYRLLKKGVDWEWGPEQEKAMEVLKEKLTSPPLLCKLHYDPEDGWGDIVLGVDASLTGWGGTLGQIDDKGKKRVSRFESGLWNHAEQQYDATKRECRGVLKCLQKLRFWLYGVHFILETDANTLVAQLNRAATDLPGALVTRWLAWIRLFDFEVRHVKGRKHTAADGLSRRPRCEDDSEDELDIDDFVAAELNLVGIAIVGVEGERGNKVGASGMSADFIGRHKHVTQHSGMKKTKSRRIELLSVNTTEVVDSEDERMGSEEEDLDISGPTGDHVNANRDHNTDKTSPPPSFTSLNPLDDNYSERYQLIARYLTTLAKPEGYSKGEYRKLKKEALNYSVRDRKLWKNATSCYPPRLVIDGDEEKETIKKELHDKTGHAGRETTYARIAARYWWPGFYDDIRTYCTSCHKCQLRTKLRQETALYPTKAAPLFHCIGIDVVKMPDCKGYDCLLVARDDFSGWVEAKPMKTPTSAKVAKFIYDEIICRHGVFGKLKVDGGSEFKKKVITELKKLGIARTVISAYNARANGMVERGHQPITQALITLSEGSKRPWVDLLNWVLFADRTTVHGPTGFTPFYMVYGREAVLPVETRYPTWRTLGWDEVNSRKKLLELRARQIEMRDEDLIESKLRKDRRRIEGKEYFDSTHNIRAVPIEKGDLVLVYDIQRMDRDKSRDTKLLYRWLGPYQVKEADNVKNTYVLEELDGTQLRRTYAGNRLKRFVKRKNYWYSPEDDVPVMPKSRSKGVEFKTDAELEEEAIKEFHEEYRTPEEPEYLETTQEIVKSTGAVVRVPPLPESERDKYIAFPEEWFEEESDGEEESQRS